MAQSEITIKDVIGHIQGMKKDLVGEIRGLGKRIDALEGRVEHMDRRLTGQIDMLDQRLDRMEITMVSQNHEGRIVRLEQHAGISA